MQRPALVGAVRHQVTAFNTLRNLLHERGVNCQSSDCCLIEESYNLQNAATGSEINSHLHNTDTGLNSQNPDIRLNSQSTATGVSLQSTATGLNYQITATGLNLQNPNIRLNLQNTDTGLNSLNTATGLNLQKPDIRLNLQNTDTGLNLQNTATGLNLQNADAGLNAQNCDNVWDNTSRSTSTSISRQITAMEITLEGGGESTSFSDGIQNYTSGHVLINRAEVSGAGPSASAGKAPTLAQIASRNRLSRVTDSTAQLLLVEKYILNQLPLDRPFTIQLKDSIEFRNICTHMALQVEDRQFDQDLNAAQQCLRTIITGLILALSAFSSDFLEGSSEDLRLILKNLCDV